MADEAFFRNLPKVSLHDHLDGGLRPATMLEIADEVGHTLPASTPDALATWFTDAANSGSLERYLTTFAHTTALMQRAEDLRRVSAEWVLDQAADGVVAAETRWAPEQHQTMGLSLDETVEAVAQGLRDGMAQAKAAGTPIIARQILCAMRHADRSLEIARLALRHRDTDLVCGFDIAGGEVGNPASKHKAAFDLLRHEAFYYTIHAGEEGPLSSLLDAIDCGAMRIGHGVRTADDISRRTDGSFVLGRLASFIRNNRIPLEICPTSNVQTGAVTELAAHPLGVLAWLGFTVTINCDNKLMGGTTLSREYALVASAFQLSITEMAQFALAGASALFLDHDEREALLRDMTSAWMAASFTDQSGQQH